MRTLFFTFCKTDLVLEKQVGGLYTIPLTDEPPMSTKPWTHIMDVENQAGGTLVRAFRIDEPIINNPQYKICGLRASFYKLPHDLYLMAGKCHELLYWGFNTKFYGVYGGPIQMHTAISRRCTQYGREVWPQLATVVIVLIHRGDEVPLVHAKNFKTDFYGLVAGSVETGETLEEAVYREVMEETSIKIKNITYFNSQPWPYPSGLVVSFSADYVGGEVRLQCLELSEGDWLSKNDLPTIPKKLFIARMLIDAWLKKGEG